MSRIYYIFLVTPLIFSTSCSKIFNKDESIPLRDVKIKTILKNHADGADYRVSSSGITVAAELIIEPGVEIHFDDGATMRVSDSGILSCKGTSDKPIILSATNKGTQWGGLIISCLEQAILDHVIITDAGNPGVCHGAITITPNSSAQIGNTEIKGCGSSPAVNIAAESNVTLLPGCRFHFNYCPIQMPPQTELNISDGSDFTGNTVDAILLKNDDGNQLVVSRNTILKKNKLPYFANSSIMISMSTFQIDPGITLWFTTGCYIFTDGNATSSLQINGTSSEPVIMDNDPQSQKTQTATWQGIYVYGGSATIRYTDIKNVTKLIKDDGAITITGNGRLIAQNDRMINCKCTCSITSKGYYTNVNSDITYSNSYINSNNYCRK